MYVISNEVFNDEYYLLPKAITIMGHGLSYRSAINRCSLHGNSLPTVNEDGVNNLEEGQMYWTNIHRRTFLKWIKDEPVKQICCKFIHMKKFKHHNTTLGRKSVITFGNTFTTRFF